MNTSRNLEDDATTGAIIISQDPKAINTNGIDATRYFLYNRPIKSV
jgi:hypothetical protein